MRKLTLISLLVFVSLMSVAQPSKPELERSFKEQVDTCSRIRFDVGPDIGKLIKCNDSLYLDYKGWYILESVESQAYYVKQGNDVRPLCNGSLPIESLKTVLSTPCDTDFTADVTQYNYGYETIHYRLPVGNLIKLCLSQGCTPFVGMEDSDDGSYVATLFMVNAQEQFNHIFQVRADKLTFERGRGDIEIKAHVYVPMKGVETFYGELDTTK